MMRLLWFSPLPPAKTDIANYTARVLTFLDELVELQLIHPDGVAAGANYQSITSGSLPPLQLNRTDICVYHIGNNVQYHAPIFSHVISHPGIVVLHDRAINELFLGMQILEEQCGGISADKAYRETMARWYGIEGLEAANHVLSGRASASSLGNRFPLYEAVLHGALGAISHNPAVSRELQLRFPKLPILDLPLPYPCNSKETAAMHSRPASLIRLAMFGFMGLNRRVNEFLQAWATSPYRDSFQLDITGEMSNRAEVESLVNAYGLEKQVLNHGFVPENRLDELIASADMVINLRNPSMGEASGSQLRIWANKTASAVSDTGWYSQLPDGCVYKIGVDSEASDLAVLLARLANGGLDLTEIAEAGWARLSQHDPGRYARNLICWLEENANKFAKRWTEVALINSVANAYAECLPQNFEASLPGQLLNPVQDAQPIIVST